MRGRRVVWPERGKVVVEDFRLPDIKPDEILFRTEFSLISPGTERASLLSLPLVKGGFPKGSAGYTAAGIVLEAGSAVTSLRPGDRVACSSGHATHGVVHQERALLVPEPVPLADAAWVNLATMALLGPRLARIELGAPTSTIAQRTDPRPRRRSTLSWTTPTFVGRRKTVARRSRTPARKTARG